MYLNTRTFTGDALHIVHHTANVRTEASPPSLQLAVAFWSSVLPAQRSVASPASSQMRRLSPVSRTCRAPLAAKRLLTAER